MNLTVSKETTQCDAKADGRVPDSEPNRLLLPSVLLLEASANSRQQRHYDLENGRDQTSDMSTSIYTVEYCYIGCIGETPP